jgi:2,3,4,5-tetrahydropyridine-2-carboxylate N-succinyltransferase
MSTPRTRLRRVVEEAWASPRRRRRAEVREAVEEVIALLDQGRLRVASPRGNGWVVHAWVKEAILLYFLHREVREVEIGPYHYRDKIPLKTDLERAGIRVVPPGTVRYGAFLEPGVVVMPGYVNIGAYVGAGTMVDTWATVGSCAQIGRDVHLSGGVGIGGVLEPIQARPVIVEDGAFLGSRCVVVEGVRVGRGAVLGAGVVLTASTPIVDVRGARPRILRGYVPPRSVLIPGSMPKAFPAGTYHVPCALLIGERKASTDAKTALNTLLRRFRGATSRPPGALLG